MPIISEPVPGQQTFFVTTGIYIAKGEDTLGPYTSLEAAALVYSGELRADDYAARDGDAGWVALADFLPLSALVPTDEGTPLTENPPPTTSEHPHRWRRLAAALLILLAAPVVLMAGLGRFGHHGGDLRAEIRPVAPPPSALPAPNPTVAAVAPAVVVAAPAATPAPAADGVLKGSVSFARSGAVPIPVVETRISIYPLAALTPTLDRQSAAVQAARASLDPQISAAAEARTARADDARAALQAWQSADSHDPLLPSLRFANEGAKVAAKTAEDDYRFLVDERSSTAGGGVFFRELPTPLLDANTDSQGHFALTLPPGDEPLVLAAQGRQIADDGTVQMRYWLLKISPAQRSGLEPLPLDDANASFSSAADSLIRTAD